MQNEVTKFLATKNDQIFIKPLGAGSEVGRSCMHVKFQNKQFLLDCGVHPAYTGVSSLPFLDLVDLSQIDAVLITHFHLDHAAALPFLTEKTNFKGKVFMTHPTKAILKYLLNDYIRIINSNSEVDFYSEQDLKNCYAKIIPIDYHQVIEVSGIKITAYNAGHVLGAAMFYLEINGVGLLYTGDFSREDDRHLKKAESMKNKQVDILITESTYGTQCHLSRAERESRFTKVVTDVVTRGGKCLLPVFALGRAQELLLILEEHWDKNKKLQKIPIYYNSALAKKCMGIYQTYLNMMNKRIQKIGLTKNPFEFKHISDIGSKELSTIKTDNKPYVIMASPGMLQSGVSRDLFERWCTDSKNGVVIAGYCVDGTLAKEILSNVDTITTTRGQNLKLSMTVEYISFSAHVDFIQNSEFIYECMPSHLFFVHGEAIEMNRLRNAIAVKNEKENVEMSLYTLKNGESAGVAVKLKNIAKLCTNLQENSFEGVLVKKNEEIEIYNLNEFLDGNRHEIKRIKFLQKQKLPFNATFDLFKQVLRNDFDAKFINENVLRVGNSIKITKTDENVLIEWEGGYIDDITVMAIGRALNDIAETSRSMRLVENKSCCHKNSYINLNKEEKHENLFKIVKGFYEETSMNDKNEICIDEDNKIDNLGNICCSDEEKENVLRTLVTKLNDLQ